MRCCFGSTRCPLERCHALNFGSLVALCLFIHFGNAINLVSFVLIKKRKTTSRKSKERSALFLSCTHGQFQWVGQPQPNSSSLQNPLQINTHLCTIGLHGEERVTNTIGSQHICDQLQLLTKLWPILETTPT